MRKRFNNSPLALPQVINMQEYGKASYKGIISKPLQVEITETLERKQQVILLMNRRGYSTYTQCKACGTVIECPDCSIPMIWHSSIKQLKCHYCNKEMSFPEYCPACGRDALSTSGVGTQKIEVLIKEYVNPRRGRLNGYYKIIYANGSVMPGTMRMPVPFLP